MKTIMLYLTIALLTATAKLVWITPVYPNESDIVIENTAGPGIWYWVTAPGGPCYTDPSDYCCEKAEQDFKDAWPFDKQIISRTFEMVSLVMHIAPDPAKPMPSVLIAEDFTDAEFASVIVGPWPEDKRFNVYSPKMQAILLSVHHADVDSLAHEIVHYFQDVYRHQEWSDHLEMEACRIQRLFE